MKKLLLASASLLFAALLTGPISGCGTDASASALAAAPVTENGRPLIKKFGTVGIDLCETSPFVFKGKLYRLDWHRAAGRLRVIDHDTRKEVCNLAPKYAFQSVLVEGDTVHVFATLSDRKGGSYRNTITQFTSKDLTTWEESPVFHDKKFIVANTSICKGDDKYVLSVEVRGGSPGAMGPWSARFMESPDLKTWTMMPEDCRQGIKGRIASPHLLRFHNGWYHLFSTVTGHPKGYTLALYRTRDFKTWESSPYNPIMIPDDADKVPYNPDFTDEDKKKIEVANNKDNSDIDFIEHDGKLVITYCWGNQVGKEFVSEAEYAGTMAQYLDGWFAAKSAVKPDTATPKK
jgi:hypothetical protein